MEYEKQLEGIATHYNHEAQGYGEGYSSPLCKAEDMAVTNHLIEVFNTLPYSGGQISVVSAGCGEGLDYDLARAALDNINPKLAMDFKGFDISDGMVANANQKHSSNQSIDKINFEVADIHQLPVPDKSVNLIVSLFGPFSYSLDPEALVKEFSRVIKPSGKLMIMPYTLRLAAGFLTGFTTAPSSERFETNHPVHKTHPYGGKEAFDLFSKFFNCVEVKGMNFIGNMTEELQEKLNIQFPDPNMVYSQLVQMDDQLNKILPPEMARHMIVTASGLKEEFI